MNTSKFISSPSRTYVIPMYSNNDHSELKFYRFTLPETEQNTCSHASWYYYNRLDFCGCGFSAFPVEFYNNISDVQQ